jgi:hypothetical protein
MINSSTYNRIDALTAEAKKLRSAARRAEAKGDFVKAATLRDKVDGINSELISIRHYGG